MMKRSYYIFSNGRLLRKQNTVYLHQYEGEREDADEQSLADAAAQAGCALEDLESDLADESGDTDGNVAIETPQTASLDETQNDSAGEADGEPTRRVLQKRPVPIEDVESFYVFGEMDLNTKLLNFLARHKVPLHLYNYFGFYSGSFMPRQEVNSGYLLVKQVEHYSQATRRLELARAFVEGASFNILKNLKYYGAASRGRDLSGVTAAVETERTKIATAKDIPTLMGIEGTIRALYYSAWPAILAPGWVEFTKRVRRPPDNPINALISFGNALCYTLALGEIYRTPLSPLISFLHEPGARRYSLSLDIAEIFKPILADRLIFKLVNNGELQPQHFEEKLNFCYLKESGRKVFLPQWDERLKQTIEHRNLGRKVSYRRLVRLECYRLERHLMGVDQYAPFKIWW
jgi:CRISP-associated protein Cas1